MDTVRKTHLASGQAVVLPFSEELLKKIADFNGAPVESVRGWLEAGKPVYTSLSVYKRET